MYYIYVCRDVTKLAWFSVADDDDGSEQETQQHDGQPMVMMMTGWLLPTHEKKPLDSVPRVFVSLLRCSRRFRYSVVEKRSALGHTQSASCNLCATFTHTNTKKSHTTMEEHKQTAETAE